MLNDLGEWGPHCLKIQDRGAPYLPLVPPRIWSWKGVGGLFSSYPITLLAYCTLSVKTSPSPHHGWWEIPVVFHQLRTSHAIGPHHAVSCQWALTSRERDAGNPTKPLRHHWGWPQGEGQGMCSQEQDLHTGCGASARHVLVYPGNGASHSEAKLSVLTMPWAVHEGIDWLHTTPTELGPPTSIPEWSSLVPFPWPNSISQGGPSCSPLSACSQWSGRLSVCVSARGLWKKPNNEFFEELLNCRIIIFSIYSASIYWAFI